MIVCKIFIEHQKWSAFRKSDLHSFRSSIIPCGFLEEKEKKRENINPFGKHWKQSEKTGDNQIHVVMTKPRERILVEIFQHPFPRYDASISSFPPKNLTVVDFFL